MTFEYLIGKYFVPIKRKKTGEKITARVVINTSEFEDVERATVRLLRMMKDKN